MEVRLRPGGARPGVGDGAPGHLLDAVCAVVLVVHVTRHVLEVMHVCADEHVSQLHEVAVRLVLHCGAGACSEWGAGQGQPSHPACCARCLDSPSTIPQGYSRPRTRCPLASTTVLLPITAKGALSCGGAGARAHAQLVWVSGWRGAWALSAWSAPSASPSMTSPQRDPSGNPSHPTASLLLAEARAGAAYIPGACQTRGQHLLKRGMQPISREFDMRVLGQRF